MNIPKWNIEAESGYKPKTTFWMDFSIADNFGIEAVQETYERAFNGWKDDYIYLTELVMVLNHKIWQHWQTNEALGAIYDGLWKTADAYAYENLSGEELEYFLGMTD